MKPRYYQDNALSAVTDALTKNPHANPLIVMPTGSGKSLVIKMICEHYNDKQVLIVTPRIRLLEQTVNLISESGVLSSTKGNDTGEHHRIVTATYQTLIKRDFVKPDIIIIDEAHTIPEEEQAEYSRLIEDHVSNTTIIGLTATPISKNLAIYGEHGKSWWNKTYEIGLIKLIEQGYLVPPRQFKTHIDIEREISHNTFERTSAILPVALSKLSDLNCKKTLIFCRSIEHVEFVHNELYLMGLSVLSVHSRMSEKQINNAYNDFNILENAVLVNCNIISTGVDLPCVDSIVLLRKISRLGLYIQIIGRGLRLFKGKKSCSILDYGSNSTRFGYIDAPNEFSNRDSHKFISNYREKSCPNCSLILANPCVKCSNCDYEFSLKPILSINSPNSALLSIDIRKSGIDKIDVTEKTTNKVTLKYTMSNGDTAFQYVSIARYQTIMNSQPFEATYRVSSKTGFIINLK